MQPQIAPAAAPPRKARIQMMTGGTTSLGMPRAIIRLAMVPMRYWPGAPMLKRPVLNATATERPVMMSGVARKSMLPVFTGLKPKVSTPPSPRPVEKMLPRTMRTPSQALLGERLSLVRPTTTMTMQPTSRPMTMEARLASTVLVPSLAQKLSRRSLMPCPPSRRRAWRRPCRGRAPALWSFSGRARRLSRPRT